MLGRTRTPNLRQLTISFSLISTIYLFFLLHVHRYKFGWGVLREWEAALPQHNLSLPSPEGQNGRYVHFMTQLVVVGWNNVLAET